MAYDFPKLLRAMMDIRGETQTELANRLSTGNLKVQQPNVSRWLKGAEPEGPTRDRIIEVAHEMGVLSDVRSEDVAATLPEGDRPRKVKLVGYVGAGARAHYYALADEDFEEVDAPLSATDRTVAVEIKGKSFGPLMDTWLVYYDNIRSPITEDLLGKICVVGLADDRILIKQIKRGRGGLFTLLSNSNEDPIEDVEIEWAARVTDMRPR